MTHSTAGDTARLREPLLASAASSGELTGGNYSRAAAALGAAAPSACGGGWAGLSSLLGSFLGSSVFLMAVGWWLAESSRAVFRKRPQKVSPLPATCAWEPGMEVRKWSEEK